MNPSSTVFSLVALALTAATVAQDPPPPPGGPDGPPPREGAPRGNGREGREGAPQEGRQRGQRGGQGQPMNVEGAMKAMGRAFKGLKEAIDDPARKDDAVRMVCEIQRSCATARMLPLPPQFTKDAADDAAKAKLQQEYAEDLRRTMRMLLDLEDAIVAGKADEAKAIYAKVAEAREHAHKELGVDD